MKKEAFQSIITFLLIIASGTLIVWLVSVDAHEEKELIYPSAFNDTTEEVLINPADPPDEHIIKVDPVFGKMLNGTDPQRVHFYEVGDDIRPDLHEVYYFPEIVTNGTQGYYEIYRTLGKDRLD